VSLAITYFDLKCPADAINCYMEELEIMEETNYKEVKVSFLSTVLFLQNAKICIFIFLRGHQSIAVIEESKIIIKNKAT